MTLGEVADDKRNTPLYIHVQDLPKSASHKDIRKCFGHLPIPEGGIYVSGRIAFFSLKLEEDVSIGMFRTQCLFDGKMINYATVTRDQMQRILFRNAKRALDFTLSGYSAKDYKAELDYLLKLKAHTRRRIRPTAVNKMDVGNLKPNNIFCPKEIEFPQDAENQQETAIRNTMQKKRLKVRRIHPTPVVELDEKELERIFMTQEAEEIKPPKKMKRDDS